MRIPVPVRATAFLSESEGANFRNRAQGHDGEETGGERDHSDTQSDECRKQDVSSQWGTKQRRSVLAQRVGRISSLASMKDFDSASD
jgi:hypothetical protein